MLAGSHLSQLIVEFGVADKIQLAMRSAHDGVASGPADGWMDQYVPCEGEYHAIALGEKQVPVFLSLNRIAFDQQQLVLCTMLNLTCQKKAEREMFEQQQRQLSLETELAVRQGQGWFCVGTVTRAAHTADDPAPVG